MRPIDLAMLLLPVLASGLLLGKRLPRSERSLLQPSALSSAPSSRHDGEAYVSTTDNVRRRKKNKYEQFSKVENLVADPFDAMIAESLEQNKFLEEELSAATKNRGRGGKNKDDAASSAAVPMNLESQPMFFPDVKSIDPYDPTTFGYIEIASIGGAHGVHGMIKVRCLTDFASERLCTAGIRHIKATNKRAPRPITLLEGRQRHADEYLIRLEGIDDRDAAMKLRGSVLYAREEDLMETESEEYIVSDLIGLDVFLYEDKEIGERNFVGKVNGIVFAEDLTDIPGLHDFLELALPRGQGGTVSLYDELVLIPLVPQLVPVIDVNDASVYIDPPEGLLDLRYVREEKVRIKAFLPPPRADTQD